MILEEIVEQKNKEVEHLKEMKHSLKSRLKKKELTLIAEIKKASPSKGIITSRFDPQQQLQYYQQGGADSISVLTDKKYFRGSNEILKIIRSRTSLPILRKDFIIDPVQVYQSRFLGADVILLIAAILKKAQLEKLLNLAYKIGLEAIVEVHNRAELEKVLTVPAQIIGINNRNLHDFSVDMTTTEKIVTVLKQKKLRNEYYIISESGIKTRDEIEFLKKIDIDGVLIGETLMQAEDPIKKIEEFKG